MRCTITVKPFRQGDIPNMRSAFRLAVLIGCVGVTQLFAESITFTYTGNGTGTINGTPFTNDPFVAVFTGGTTAETPSGDGFDLSVTGNIALTGFGLASIENPQTATYQLPNLPAPPGSNALFWVAGHDGGGDGGVFLSGGIDFNTWSGTSPLGPEPFFLFGSPTDSPAWLTDLGSVVFTDVSSATFGGEGVLNITASPEPSSFVMMLVACLAVLCPRSFKRRY
jgi:hypothetical protein